MEQEKTAGAREARREEWRRIIAGQQACGQSAAAYCRERGIPVWKFSYWRKEGGIGVSPEISKYALPVTAFMPFAIIGAFPLNATCQIAPSYRTAVSSPCPAT